MELVSEDDGRVAFVIHNVLIQNTPHVRCLNASLSRNISKIVKFSENSCKVSSICFSSLPCSLTPLARKEGI